MFPQGSHCELAHEGSSEFTANMASACELPDPGGRRTTSVWIKSDFSSPLSFGRYSSDAASTVGTCRRAPRSPSAAMTEASTASICADESYSP